MRLQVAADEDRRTVIDARAFIDTEEDVPLFASGKIGKLSEVIGTRE
jgi:hypothetical protein